MSTIYFRQSEVKKFKRCPRSWWLSYKKDGSGYEPAPSDHPLSGQRDVGMLVHSGLEALDRDGIMPWVEIERLRVEHCLALGIVTPSKEYQDVFELASIMVRGYVDWLAETGVNAREKILHVEKQFEVPIGRIRGEDVILTGRVDRIIEDTLTNEIIVSDTKTVQSLDQVGAQLQVDDQGLLYLTLVQAALNIPVRRFRHDMLRKVKRSARATPPFYGRHEVAYNATQLDNAWTHTVVVLDKMVECLQLLGDQEYYHHSTVYPNPTKDCTWDCDFLPVCPMMDDGSSWQGMLQDTGIYIRRELPQ